MRIRLTLALLLALALAVGCPARSPAQRVLWRDVLRMQAASNSNPGSLELRQKYVDSLASFLKAFPNDKDALALYEKEELSYARELVKRGRLAAAMQYYQSILSRHPDRQEVRAELEEVRERADVPRDRFDDLRKGMSMDDVRDLLGDPRRGWTHTMQKGSKVEETWYYKKEGGGMASVSFLDGKAFVAEYDGIVMLEP